MRASPWVSSAMVCGLVGGACSGKSSSSGFGPGGTDAGMTTDGGAGPIEGDGAVPRFGDGQADGRGGGACAVTDPNADTDHDGWSPNQGDCNDCDPNVNPGAID